MRNAMRMIQFLILAVILVATCETVCEAVTTAQRRQAQQIRSTARRAERFATSGQFKKSLELLKEAQNDINELAGASPDKGLSRLLSPIVRDLKSLHGTLDLEGANPPALKLPELASDSMKQGAKPTGETAPGNTSPPADGAISFAKQIAPLLNAKCGRCHVDDAKGDFSMASYSALRRGIPDTGIVLTPGGSQGSRLIEVIETGDMPRGRGNVSAAELTLLKNWIDQGAKFDGQSPNTPLRTLTGGTAQPKSEPVEMKVVQATGKETVRFALDIAPVLSENCLGCHGGRRTQSGLNLSTFRNLLRGGDSGSLVVPGKPAESLLVQKLKGTAEDGARMPLQRPALPSETIKKIETWIAEGAKFDAPDANASLETVAALVRAETSTPDELSAMRVESAEKNWRLAVPSDSPQTVTTDHFFVLGNAPEAHLQKIGEAAERRRPKIAKALGLGSKPMAKGRVTIFVAAHRYDYGEFGTMVEKVQFPRDQQAHFRFNLVDAYVCLAAPRTVDEAVEETLSENLAGVYVASAGNGNLPQWFTAGTARAIVDRLAPRSEKVIAWNNTLKRSLSQQKKPDDFMTGRVNAKAEEALSFAFCKALMTNSSRYRALLASVKDGATFEEATKKVYGVAPNELAAAWVTQASKSGR